MDWSRASEAERVCDGAIGVQWPKDRKPIFFIAGVTRDRRECRRRSYPAVRGLTRRRGNVPWGTIGTRRTDGPDEGTGGNRLRRCGGGSRGGTAWPPRDLLQSASAGRAGAGGELCDRLV